MTNTTLARSTLQKAQVRLKVLDVLLQHEAYSDVVREAQEAVEIALKGMLRQVGIEPPKYHDVGPFLLDKVRSMTCKKAIMGHRKGAEDAKRTIQ